MNVVLMAGGGGTRLWPLSRQQNPKQFLTFGGSKTLLEMTFDRAKHLTDVKNIYVATMSSYGERIRGILTEVPAENIFYEPERRDNAAAIASVAVRIVMRGQGDEPTLFMWSDHVFTNEEEFRHDLQRLSDLLKKNPNSFVIMGHTPTSPETGFGYIEANEAREKDVFVVKSFKEKPDKATAEKYVAAGNYFWNLGYVTVRPNYLLEELKRYEPELMNGIDMFRQALEQKDEAKANEIYGTLPKTSIDYAVLERTPTLFVITGDYGWSDVGNWSAVQDIFGVKGDHMPKGHHVNIDSEHNYIYNATNKAVSLIGIKNTIVVVTNDAILVTNKNDAHKVKDVVARLEKDGKTELL